MRRLLIQSVYPGHNWARNSQRHGEGQILPILSRNQWRLSDRMVPVKQCSCVRYVRKECWLGIPQHTSSNLSRMTRPSLSLVGLSLRMAMSTKQRKNDGLYSGRKQTLLAAPESCIKPTSSGICSIPCGQRMQIVSWYLTTLGISKDSPVVTGNHSTQSLKCICERVDPAALLLSC